MSSPFRGAGVNSGEQRVGARSDVLVLMTSLLLGILASSFVKASGEFGSTWSAKTAGHLGLITAEQVRRHATAKQCACPSRPSMIP
jgi:hypothetical protein